MNYTLRQLVIAIGLLLTGWSGAALCDQEDNFSHSVFRPVVSPSRASPCAPTVICDEGSASRAGCQAAGAVVYGAGNFRMYSWPSSIPDVSPLLGLGGWASQNYARSDCNVVSPVDQTSPITIVAPRYDPAFKSPRLTLFGNPVSDRKYLNMFLEAWSEISNKGCPAQCKPFDKFCIACEVSVSQDQCTGSDGCDTPDSGQNRSRNCDVNKENKEAVYPIDLPQEPFVPPGRGP